jgi:hypothetical protein
MVLKNILGCAKSPSWVNKKHRMQKSSRVLNDDNQPDCVTSALELYAEILLNQQGTEANHKH